MTFGGAAITRQPAEVFVRSSIDPLSPHCAAISTTPPARSTHPGRRAQASPIRQPVPPRNSTRSTRSSCTAVRSVLSAPSSSSSSSQVSARAGALLGAEITATSLVGFTVSASCLIASCSIPEIADRTLRAVAGPWLAVTAIRNLSRVETVTSDSRRPPNPGVTKLRPSTAYLALVVGARLWFASTSAIHRSTRSLILVSRVRSAPVAAVPVLSASATFKCVMALFSEIPKRTTSRTWPS